MNKLTVCKYPTSVNHSEIYNLVILHLVRVNCVRIDRDRWPKIRKICLNKVTFLKNSY